MSQFSFNTSLFGSGSTPSFGSATLTPPVATSFGFGSGSTTVTPPVTTSFASGSQQNTPVVPVENTNAPLMDFVYDFMDNNKVKIISHDNLLTLATEYYKAAETKEDDIVDTLKSMICSSQYMFSERFKREKMNLNDVQFKFRMLTQPQSISNDEIIAKLFKTNNTVQQV
jgi:hypothetical protein